MKHIYSFCIIVVFSIISCTDEEFINHNATFSIDDAEAYFEHIAQYSPSALDLESFCHEHSHDHDLNDCDHHQHPSSRSVSSSLEPIWAKAVRSENNFVELIEVPLDGDSYLRLRSTHFKKQKKENELFHHVGAKLIIAKDKRCKETVIFIANLLQDAPTENVEEMVNSFRYLKSNFKGLVICSTLRGEPLSAFYYLGNGYTKPLNLAAYTPDISLENQPEYIFLSAQKNKTSTRVYCNHCNGTGCMFCWDNDGGELGEVVIYPNCLVCGGIGLSCGHCQKCKQPQCICTYCNFCGQNPCRCKEIGLGCPYCGKRFCWGNCEYNPMNPDFGNPGSGGGGGNPSGPPNAGTLAPSSITQNANDVVETIKRLYGDAILCNLGVNMLFKSLYPFSYELENKTANEMLSYWETYPAVWQPIDISEAQWYANEGYFVVAGLASSPMGHVVVVVPGEARYNGSWGMNVPMVFDTGSVKEPSQPISLSWRVEYKSLIKFYKYINP